MTSWALFLLVTFVAAIVISTIMLLKHNAKMKFSDSVQENAKKKQQEEAKEERKKPTDQ